MDKRAYRDALPSPIANHGQIGDGKLGRKSHVCKVGPGVPEGYRIG
jgi:hypothetical protein